MWKVESKFFSLECDTKAVAMHEFVPIMLPLMWQVFTGLPSYSNQQLLQRALPLSHYYKR